MSTDKAAEEGLLSDWADHDARFFEHFSPDSIFERLSRLDEASET
jgi:hypothetical protein